MSTENVREKVKYGLPEEVVFCKKCVLSNQLPYSSKELSASKKTTKSLTFMGEDGVCEACKYQEMKDNLIDWKERERMLARLCDRFRSKDGSYDVVVPGSGGKDSRFVAHILKDKYGMTPLTVTWPPAMYTEIGKINFDSWLNYIDNISINPNKSVHRLLTRLAFENLVHPFQPFIIGQKLVAPRIAIKYKIPLIFYGETPAEYGAHLDDAINEKFTMPEEYYYVGNLDLNKIFLGGVSARELIEKYNVDRRDLNMYLPITKAELESFPLEYQFMGHYVRWDTQENYYYAVENTGFKPNPERTEGTHSKYASLDDRIDGFHYYTSFIKFGVGRCTFDAALEIRNGKLTRDEGVALVRKFDGEFPRRYFKDVLEYMGITEARFWEVIENAYSPHLWSKENGEWKLHYQVS